MPSDAVEATGWKGGCVGTITRHDLARILATEVDCTLTEAERLVNSFLQAWDSPSDSMPGQEICRVVRRGVSSRNW